MNFSSRDVGNGCSNPDLSEEDIDNLQFELTKVTQLFWTIHHMLHEKGNMFDIMCSLLSLLNKCGFFL